MTGPATYHRGKRNFGTGYDMIDRIEAIEAENARLRDELSNIAVMGSSSDSSVMMAIARHAVIRARAALTHARGDAD